MIVTTDLRIEWWSLIAALSLGYANATGVAEEARLAVALLGVLAVHGADHQLIVATLLPARHTRWDMVVWAAMGLSCVYERKVNEG